MGLAEQGEDARREEHRVVDQVPVVDQFVDRLERLGIARLAGGERALHLLLGGDVAHGADQADGAAVGTAHRAGAVLQPAHFAGSDPDAVLALEAIGALHEIVAQGIAIVRIVLRQDALVPLLRPQAARIESEHAVELRRDEQRVVGDVPLVEPFRRRFGDQGIELLAGAQCGLGAADVGDVGEGEQQAAVRHPAMAGNELTAVGAAALDRALVTGIDFRLPRGDQRIGRARPFVALRVEPQEGGEGLAGLAQADRIAGQSYKRPVATDEGLGAVEQGKPLAERVESGDQDVFRCELAFGWLVLLDNRHSALPGECPPRFGGFIA